MEACPDAGCGWWTAVTAFMALLATTLTLILNIYFKMEDWRLAEERARRDNLDAERESDLLHRQVDDLKTALENLEHDNERLRDIIQQSEALLERIKALDDQIAELEENQYKYGLGEDQKSE